MVGGFLKKTKKMIPTRREHERGSAGEYIDLAEMEFPDEAAALSGARSVVKVAEINGYDDLAELTSELYNGNILVIDFTMMANDDLELKRVIGELKSVAKDTGGDVAGIAKNMLAATPGGIKISRKKIKPGF
jgi:SepF-like predicted cell division protein (DUF552 family)